MTLGECLANKVLNFSDEGYKQYLTATREERKANRLDRKLSGEAKRIVREYKPSKEKEYSQWMKLQSSRIIKRNEHAGKALKAKQAMTEYDYGGNLYEVLRNGPRSSVKGYEAYTSSLAKANPVKLDEVKEIGRSAGISEDKILKDIIGHSRKNILRDHTNSSLLRP